ncbi:hypothetical protein ACFPT5_11725 [Ornithinimicrobium kibberense]
MRSTSRRRLPPQKTLRRWPRAWSPTSPARCCRSTPPWTLTWPHGGTPPPESPGSPSSARSRPRHGANRWPSARRT